MQAATTSGFTPFAALQAEVLRDPIPLRAAVTAAYRKDEVSAVQWLLDQLKNHDTGSISRPSNWPINWSARCARNAPAPPVSMR
jgi:RHH-type proline utilization regulon transcriptional repressor/proline dehydrogenase/delta 1-pyrroline-5-carboxylate dehydrogenase